MENGRIGTLHLTGEDAVRFVHSFFCPSADEINEREAIRTRRNENVCLRRNENGFSAEISDLDLSFLDEEITEEKVSITVTVSVKIQEQVFNSNDLPEMFAQMSISTSKDVYTLCETGETTKIAA
jgi:hypothetical protein